MSVSSLHQINRYLETLDITPHEDLLNAANAVRESEKRVSELRTETMTVHQAGIAYLRGEIELDSPEMMKAVALGALNDRGNNFIDKFADRQVREALENQTPWLMDKLSKTIDKIGDKYTAAITALNGTDLTEPAAILRAGHEKVKAWEDVQRYELLFTATEQILSLMWVAGVKSNYPRTKEFFLVQPDLADFAQNGDVVTSTSRSIQIRKYAQRGWKILLAKTEAEAKARADLVAEERKLKNAALKKEKENLVLSVGATEYSRTRILRYTGADGRPREIDMSQK